MGMAQGIKATGFQDVDEIPSETNAKTFNATALASVNAEVDNALDTAIPGSPAAGSLNEVIKAIGDFDGNTNLRTLLAALGIPDVAAKPLYTCLVTDRLDNATYGLSALQVLIAALQTDLDNGTDGLGALKALIDALNDLSAAQVNTEVDNALDTAIPGSPTANSINERIKTLDDAYTATRAGYLDELDFDLQGTLATIAAYIDTEIGTVDTVVDGIQTDLSNATDGLGALKAIMDTSGVLMNARSAAASRLAGVSHIFEKSITSAANAGDVTVATITTQPCLIESITIHADNIQTGDLTSAGIFGGAAKVITFIAAADALQADLDAVDKQVSWIGSVRLAATKTIVISLVGTGATAVDLTVIVKYRATADGGYLA